MRHAAACIDLPRTCIHRGGKNGANGERARKEMIEQEVDREGEGGRRGSKRAIVKAVCLDRVTPENGSDNDACANTIHKDHPEQKA